MSNICLCTLIGLPGAGKTTFSQTLLTKCTEYNIIHICFDEFLQIDVFEDIRYKLQRNNILKNLKLLLDSIQQRKVLPEIFQNSSKITENITKYCIILDDNNFYRSMRYEILKIARNNKISFGEIYFELDLSSALIRNRLRTNALPESVIQRMCSVLEPPYVKNQWEKDSLIISSKGEVDLCKVYASIALWLETPQATRDVVEKIPMEQSIIHKIDLLLRKRIGEIIKDRTGSGCNNLADVGRELNNKRKIILNDIKSGILELTEQTDCEGLVSLLNFI